MFTFLVILILIIASLLILAVLVQNSKKEGLGNLAFGNNAGASQLMGVKKTSDLLEQITWGLVISLFVLTLASSLFLDQANQSGALTSSPNIDRAREQESLPNAEESNLPTPQSDSPDTQ